MKLRLFWKLGLVYVILLLSVLIAVDTYIVRALRQEYLSRAFAQLDSILRIMQSRPQWGGPAELSAWAVWIAKSGARVTLVAADGRVLADSEGNPARMENHAGRPEIRAAFLSLEGQAVRHSDTLNRDLVYLAVRQITPKGEPAVIRLALPVQHLDEALTGFRMRLWTVSFVILILAGSASLLFFRVLSLRIEGLKQFSRRIADGDFKPVPVDRRGDELSDLSITLSETAAQLSDTIKTLTRERNQSAAILRSMAEGVAVIGPDQRVLFCNVPFCRVLGIAGSSWEGRPMAEVICQSDLLEAIRQALAGHDSVRIEVAAGAVKTQSFAVTAMPVRSDGSSSGAVMVLHDITELRRLERARRDFVANVSHEFKTPLTAIQGFAETLLGGALDDKENRRRFLEIMRDNASRLSRLTDDLLKLSQIEAGEFQKEFRAIDIPDLIERCLETTRLEAEAKQIQLEAECEPDLPPATGDMGALHEILQNLLDNAVRYTQPGGRVSITAAAVGDKIMISVADTGIGIPKVEQERIFERFYRVDAARSRELGGTGLGLSIAKHLVEAHGGCIEVDSEVGRGSTFHVRLPRG